MAITLNGTTGISTPGVANSGSETITGSLAVTGAITSNANMNLSGATKYQVGGVTTNALAWVNFNGATAGTNAARSSYNVTSVTKNAAGDYTINFTNAMTDTNYVMIGGISSNASSSSTMPIVKSATQLGSPSNQTTTACQILNVNYSGAVTDNMTYIYCVFFGN